LFLNDVTALVLSLRSIFNSSDVEVLYHSGLGFNRRMYESLGMYLCRIELHEPLASIRWLPMLYFRDMLPTICVRALHKIYKVWILIVLSSIELIETEGKKIKSSVLKSVRWFPLFWVTGVVCRPVQLIGRRWFPCLPLSCTGQAGRLVGVKPN